MTTQIVSCLAIVGSMWDGVTRNLAQKIAGVAHAPEFAQGLGVVLVSLPVGPVVVGALKQPRQIRRFHGNHNLPLRIQFLLNRHFIAVAQRDQ